MDGKSQSGPRRTGRRPLPEILRGIARRSSGGPNRRRGVDSLCSAPLLSRVAPLGVAANSEAQGSGTMTLVPADRYFRSESGLARLSAAADEHTLHEGSGRSASDYLIAAVVARRGCGAFGGH